MKAGILQWFKEWEWSFPAAAIFLCGATTLLAQTSDLAFAQNSAAVLFAYLTGMAIIVWGIHAFTGNPEERSAYGVNFAYFVMAVSLAVLILPPVMRADAFGGEPLGLVSGCVATEGAHATLACPPEQDGKSRASNNQWLLNIGGTLSGQAAGSTADIGTRANRATIAGGIVVPLPFVVIALFGGAISLSRRIPELQKRAEESYIATQDAPKLTHAELREKLLFQIVQYVSAPMIAIVAYQAIKPDSQSSAAALAFICGFGSETVLLMIRGLADGLRPKGATLSSAQDVVAAPGEMVLLRITVNTEGLDPGSLAITVDGKAAQANEDGFLEVELEAGKEHLIIANAKRMGQLVTDELRMTPLVTDDARPFALNP
ncbi:hypothetical protein [Duganella sp. Root336D2]|uniref:hypothetical protein n=1 Tax=Duganella sp. Root336D2 TaxID=1736518 RepID=UPI0006F741B2|nr:hypothetical protein [Duganella sp. Root336D2]KQV46662.1 hypothetical protein ASD07_14485 [Duganella sp. Root336D2]